MIALNARNIGEIRLRDFCPRCFWIKNRHPINRDNPYYSPMASLFSTLDAYIKQVVDTALGMRSGYPIWLTEFLNSVKAVDMIKPRKIKVNIGGFELVGEPDALWRLEDGTILIADYKVARLTGAQESIFPLYEAQLNAYAYLMGKRGENVSSLALIYLQPQRYRENPDFSVEICREKFTLHFDWTVKFVKKWDEGELETLVLKAGEILSLSAPPPGRDNCSGCLELRRWVEGLLNAVNNSI